jgi:hypothetical protein
MRTNPATALLAMGGSGSRDTVSAPCPTGPAPPHELFVLERFRRHGPGSRIDVVDLAAREAGYGLVDVLVFRSVFGNKILHAVSGLGAAVEEERHGASICSTSPDCVDQDQGWIAYDSGAWSCGRLRSDYSGAMDAGYAGAIAVLHGWHVRKLLIELCAGHFAELVRTSFSVAR